MHARKEHAFEVSSITYVLKLRSQMTTMYTRTILWFWHKLALLVRVCPLRKSDITMWKGDRVGDPILSTFWCSVPKTASRNFVYKIAYIVPVNELVTGEV